MGSGYARARRASWQQEARRDGNQKERCVSASPSVGRASLRIWIFHRRRVYHGKRMSALGTQPRREAPKVSEKTKRPRITTSEVPRVFASCSAASFRQFCVRCSVIMALRLADVGVFSSDAPPRSGRRESCPASAAQAVERRVFHSSLCWRKVGWKVCVCVHVVVGIYAYCSALLFCQLRCMYGVSLVVRAAGVSVSSPNAPPQSGQRERSPATARQAVRPRVTHTSQMTAVSR